MTTRADEVRPHPKGRTVDVVTSVDAGGEVVWESTSTYLRRGRDGLDQRPTPRPTDAGPTEIPPGRVTWRLAGDLGRRYAAVSGDHNPIHLYPLTAKALGFPRQIAHGMWSLARCVAALENRLPDAVTVDVAFKKPIFLPGSVAFGVARHDGGHGRGAGVRAHLTEERRPHLVGRSHRAGVRAPGPPGAPRTRPCAVDVRPGRDRRGPRRRTPALPRLPRLAPGAAHRRPRPDRRLLRRGGLGAGADRAARRLRPPDGGLLLAREAGLALGCVAVKRLDDDVVRDEADVRRARGPRPRRGARAGRGRARAGQVPPATGGCTSTPASGRPRRSTLYRSLGFTEVAPYHDVPDDSAGWSSADWTAAGR